MTIGFIEFGLKRAGFKVYLRRTRMMAFITLCRSIFTAFLFWCSFTGLFQGDAEAVWPMYHHDIRHSSQSEYVGPLNARLHWSKYDWPKYWASFSSPVIRPDGKIYFADLDHVHLMDSNGNEIWSFNTGWTDSTPPSRRTGRFTSGHGTENSMPSVRMGRRNGNSRRMKISG